MVLFEVGWYILLLQGDERMVIDHNNGFTMITNTRYEASIEPYVLPSQYEQVFYSQVLGRNGWSCVVRFKLNKCHLESRVFQLIFYLERGTLKK